MHKRFSKSLARTLSCPIYEGGLLTFVGATTVTRPCEVNSALTFLTRRGLRAASPLQRGDSGSSSNAPARFLPEPVSHDTARASDRPRDGDSADAFSTNLEQLATARIDGRRTTIAALSSAQTTWHQICGFDKGATLSN
ncbi:hypothetical protein [Candidatus Accumulibacter sp. ACC005]|uniref:hypothetical protein n=1 Tax=Candidatus Accumulibacter sp. ACC005 TaxID=2823331 RepID=UPI0025C1536D|nr:hypothetical protein [Candidatus Accumulibacter sp. ACC005]